MLRTFPAVRTQTLQRQMDRLRLKPRLARCHAQEFSRLRQIEINQLSATSTNRVIVTIRLPVIPAGAITETDLANESRILQIAERVVDCGKADRGHTPTGQRKDLAGCGML